MKSILIPKGVKVACGKKIKMPFDSDNPEKGCGILECGDGIICSKCKEWNDANATDSAVEGGQ